MLVEHKLDPNNSGVMMEPTWALPFHAPFPCSSLCYLFPHSITTNELEEQECAYTCYGSNASEEIKVTAVSVPSTLIPILPIHFSYLFLTDKRQ